MLLLGFLRQFRLLSNSSLNSTGSSSSLSSLDEPSSVQPTFISYLLVNSSRNSSGFSSLLQKYFLSVRQMPLPMAAQSAVLKWRFSRRGLQKECSMVQLQGRLRRWWTVRREVPSLPRRMPKLHWQQLKLSISLQKRQGMCLEMQGLALFWQPYMNTPFFFECACRSMNRKQFFCSTIARFVKQISGLLILLSNCHTRFKSQPDKLHRQLPFITPSGFSIGTILNMKHYRSFFAYSQLEIRKLMRPSQTKDDGVQPGCTRLVINATFFSRTLLKLVIVIKSTQLPPGDSVSVLRLKIEVKWGSLVIASRWLSSIEKVQGGLWAKQVMSPWCSKVQVKESVWQVLSPPMFMLFLRYWMSSHWRCQVQLLVWRQTETFMPLWNEEQLLSKLMMWKRTFPSLLLLCTRKKNHWVQRVVFTSFCSNRQYQFSTQACATRARFPLSNLLSKHNYGPFYFQRAGGRSPDSEQQAFKQANFKLLALLAYLGLALYMGFQNSLLKLLYFIVCCQFAYAEAKEGARSKDSCEN